MEGILFVIQELLIAAVMVAGVAGAGWAVGQWLPVKLIIVGATATVAVLGVAFLVVDSQSRPHDANIGAGLVLIVLVAVLVATPAAVVSARKQTHR
jgi:hypothetical protein